MISSDLMWRRFAVSELITSDNENKNSYKLAVRSLTKTFN